MLCLGCDREFKPRQFNQRPVCGSCKKIYRLSNRAERRYRQQLLMDAVEREAEAQTREYDKGEVVTPAIGERIIEWLGR